MTEGVPGDGPGFVGTWYSQVVPASGRLYLGYDDEVPDFGDNGGAFTVTITTSPPAWCDSPTGT